MFRYCQSSFMSICGTYVSPLSELVYKVLSEDICGTESYFEIYFLCYLLTQSLSLSSSLCVFLTVVCYPA